MLADDEDL